MILGRPEIDQLLLHQHQYAEKVNHEYSPIFTRIFFYVKLPSESCNQSKVLTSSLDILEYPYFDCEWQWLLLELHKLHICNEFMLFHKISFVSFIMHCIYLDMKSSIVGPVIGSIDMGIGSLVLNQ